MTVWLFDFWRFHQDLQVF